MISSRVTKKCDIVAMAQLPIDERLGSAIYTDDDISEKE